MSSNCTRLHTEAFDHDRPVKASGFESFEDRWEIDLAGAELDHDVALEFAAVFGVEAGNVRRDRVDLGNRILARVMDNIAGVIPDREIPVIDLFEDGSRSRHRPPYCRLPA